MSLWHLWWVWMAGGLALAVLEVLVPGYVFLGFAVGAVLVGIGLLLPGGLLVGGLAAQSVPVLLLVFALLSLVAWVVLRRLLGVRAGQVKLWDRDINDN